MTTFKEGRPDVSPSTGQEDNYREDSSFSLERGRDEPGLRCTHFKLSRKLWGLFPVDQRTGRWPLQGSKGPTQHEGGEQLCVSLYAMHRRALLATCPSSPKLLPQDQPPGRENKASRSLWEKGAALELRR